MSSACFALGKCVGWLSQSASVIYATLHEIMESGGNKGSAGHVDCLALHLSCSVVMKSCSLITAAEVRSACGDGCPHNNTNYQQSEEYCNHKRIWRNLHMCGDGAVIQ